MSGPALLSQISHKTTRWVLTNSAICLCLEFAEFVRTHRVSLLEIWDASQPGPDMRGNLNFERYMRTLPPN